MFNTKCHESQLLRPLRSDVARAKLLRLGGPVVSRSFVARANCFDQRKSRQSWSYAPIYNWVCHEYSNNAANLCLDVSLGYVPLPWLGSCCWGCKVPALGCQSRCVGHKVGKPADAKRKTIGRHRWNSKCWRQQPHSRCHWAPLRPRRAAGKYQSPKWTGPHPRSSLRLQISCATAAVHCK